MLMIVDVNKASCKNRNIFSKTKEISQPVNRS